MPKTERSDQPKSLEIFGILKFLEFAKFNRRILSDNWITRSTMCWVGKVSRAENFVLDKTNKILARFFAVAQIYTQLASYISDILKQTNCRVNNQLSGTIYVRMRLLKAYKKYLII